MLPGLGANPRVFECIDLPEFEEVFINWHTPSKTESLRDYAKKIAAQIDDPEPILIGLSFGGMMCMEVAKFIKPALVILLSSVKGHLELPWYYRLAGWLNLQKIAPKKWIKRDNPLLPWFMGLGTAKEKKMFEDMRIATDPVLLKWSIDQIIHWQNTEVPENTIQIHGSLDRMLPLRYTKPDHILPDAGHFMSVSHAEELSSLLAKILLPYRQK